MSPTDRHRRLPVRLLPRRRAQIPALLVFGFFLGFAIFWMAGAAGIFDPNEGTITFPPPGGWAANSFALVGLPIAAIGLGGIIRAVLKLLPNSPYYHLEINADGLFIRSLFKQTRHLWRELPVFETLEHRRRTKNGTRITWYTVAVENAPLEPGMEAGATHRREVLRINADEYGAKNGQQDALDLAAWLNDLRALAIDNRLSTSESVEVPAGFVANAMTAPGRPATVNRTPTVVRR
jgi:hypothetical protein